LQIRRGSSLPASIGQQVPSRPVWLQVEQAPWQPMLQQTPSVQNPDAQSPSLTHTAPRGFGPQLPFTQVTPLTQSTSDRQVTTQARFVVSQLKGAQIVAGPDLQVPRPSQTFTSTTAAPSQAPALQIAPWTWRRQPPLPSQVPSIPQVDTSVAGQSVASRGAPPAGTNVQTPGDPWVLQARHLSVQAVLQQTPSTQKPLWQSLAQAQLSPGFPVPPASAVQWPASVDASMRPGGPPPPDEQPATASAINSAMDSIARRHREDSRRAGVPHPWGARRQGRAGETAPITRQYHVVRAD
jgi:hypothetical protein